MIDIEYNILILYMSRKEVFMKRGVKNNKVYDDYKSGIEVRCDLKRLKDIQKTIDDIKNQIEIYECENEDKTNYLKDKIYKLTIKDSYLTDNESQKLVKQLQDRIEFKEELFKRRQIILINQLNEFKKAYNKLYNKKIKVRCGDLKKELEKDNNKLYINLSVGIVSYDCFELSDIISEYQDKTCCIDMTISDKKHPEYYKELNKILYVNRFPVNFEDEQYDGNNLSSHLTIGYGFTDDPKRYTYLKIEDPSEINIKFKLGELTKENDNWKPAKLIRDAVCNCKDNEYKKNKKNQKTKRI